MLSQAIFLAREPQTIITLWPNESIADWGFNHCLGILDDNIGAGFRIARRRGPPIIEFSFAELHFLPLRAHPGQYLARGIHSLSILTDHTVDDFYLSYGGTRYHHYMQWQEAIRQVQSLNESRQTRDALWRSLMAS